MSPTKSFVSSFLLSSLVFLSTVLGYSEMSDGNQQNEIQEPGNHYLPYPLLNQHRKHDSSVTRHDDDLFDLPLRSQQQSYAKRGKDYLKEVESLHEVNETLWAAVVNATRRKSFDWTELSRALDFMEKDFKRGSSSLNSNSQEPDEELKNEFSKSKIRTPTSRWKFTYHRVFTFLRNSSTGLGVRRAIAAMSASEIRPSSSSTPPFALLHQSLPLPSSTSSLITNPLSYPKNTMSNVHGETFGQGTPPSPFTLENEIISRLLQKGHHHHHHSYHSYNENVKNQEYDDGYQNDDQRLDSSSMSTSSPSSSSSSTSFSSFPERYFQEALRKLNDHSHGSGPHHPLGSLHYLYHQNHHHVTNHQDQETSLNRPYGHSHHFKRHDPMK